MRRKRLTRHPFESAPFFFIVVLECSALLLVRESLRQFVSGAANEEEVEATIPSGISLPGMWGNPHGFYIYIDLYFKT